MTTRLATNIDQFRENRYSSSDIFRNRWSPRAMTGQKISQEMLMTLIEAAHWAPSSYNNQPWRFIYAHRDTPEFDKLYNLLGEFNKKWCRNAAVLVVVVSKMTFDRNGKPSRTHSYDTGAAWGMFALEGSIHGLVVHGMQGFDYDRARTDLNIPDGFQVEAMAAIGVLADPETLPEDIRKREKPSSRKEFDRIISEGRFTDRLS